MLVTSENFHYHSDTNRLIKKSGKAISYQTFNPKNLHSGWIEIKI